MEADVTNALGFADLQRVEAAAVDAADAKALTPVLATPAAMEAVTVQLVVVLAAVVIGDSVLQRLYYTQIACSFVPLIICMVTIHSNRLSN